VLGGAFVIAPLTWVWACRRISGTYLNNEIERYCEFVWLPQAFGRGGRVLLSRLELASVSSMRELLGADGLVLGVLAAFMVAAIWAGVRLDAATPEDRALLTATGLTIALSLAFGWESASSPPGSCSTLSRPCSSSPAGWPPGSRSSPGPRSSRRLTASPTAPTLTATGPPTCRR
jgi:hypothetical protein